MDQTAQETCANVQLRRLRKGLARKSGTDYCIATLNDCGWNAELLSTISLPNMKFIFIKNCIKMKKANKELYKRRNGNV